MRGRNRYFKKYTKMVTIQPAGNAKLTSTTSQDAIDSRPSCLRSEGGNGTGPDTNRAIDSPPSSSSSGKATDWLTSFVWHKGQKGDWLTSFVSVIRSLMIVDALSMRDEREKEGARKVEVASSFAFLWERWMEYAGRWMLIKISTNVEKYPLNSPNLKNLKIPPVNPHSKKNTPWLARFQECDGL